MTVLSKKLKTGMCLVCGKPLHINNAGQVVKYHAECRKYRNHKRNLVMIPQEG